MIQQKRSGALKSFFQKSEITTAAILVLLITVFTLIEPAFLSDVNIFSVLKTLAFYGIVAIGETLVIMCGDIDISVGSTASLGAILSAYLMTRTGCLGMIETGAEGVGVIICLILTVIICSVVGFINAFLIVDLNLPAFIATIATQYSVRGMVMVITRGIPIYPLPAFFTESIGAAEIRLTQHGGISFSFILFILLVIAFDFILKHTAYGRNLYATGGNREMAELSGIHTRFIRYSGFVITAMLAAVAGILVAAFTKQGYPPIGQGWEMWIIAAIVIGGVSLNGGEGSIIGTFLGMLIMNVLNSGMVMMNFNTFLQQVVIGIIMLLAVCTDIARKKRKVEA